MTKLVLPEFNVTGILFAVGQITWEGKVWRKATNLFPLKWILMKLIRTTLTWGGLMAAMVVAHPCPVSPSPWRNIRVAWKRDISTFFKCCIGVFENRVLGGGRHNNWIWHFCLGWSLLCQLEWEQLLKPKLEMLWKLRREKWWLSWKSHLR